MRCFYTLQLFGIAARIPFSVAEPALLQQFGNLLILNLLPFLSKLTHKRHHFVWCMTQYYKSDLKSVVIASCFKLLLLLKLRHSASTSTVHLSIAGSFCVDLSIPFIFDWCLIPLIFLSFLLFHAIILVIIPSDFLKIPIIFPNRCSGLKSIF